MYLQKIKSGFENPTFKYSHNNVCYGLEGILKTCEMDIEVRGKLNVYLTKIDALSYCHPWTGAIDWSKFDECNRLFNELADYLDGFTFG